jgi:N-acetylglucosamine-6-phosphate deacetylase
MLTGNILTPDGWITARSSFENGRITMVDGTPADPANNDAPYILPGFIDLHVHGGGGADVMEAATRSRRSRAPTRSSARRACSPPR